MRQAKSAFGVGNALYNTIGNYLDRLDDARGRREFDQLFADGVQPPTLETTIHGVFRFDDAGRIALLYLTPYDADALEAYLP